MTGSRDGNRERARPGRVENCRKRGNSIRFFFFSFVLLLLLSLEFEHSIRVRENYTVHTQKMDIAFRSPPRRACRCFFPTIFPSPLFYLRRRGKTCHRTTSNFPFSPRAFLLSHLLFLFPSAIFAPWLGHFLPYDTLMQYLNRMTYT